MSDEQRRTTEQQLLDGDLPAWDQYELARQRSVDTYRHQMEMIVFFYLWGEEDAERYQRQERERRQYIEQGSAGMRTVLQEYADQETRINERLHAEKLDSRAAENRFRANQQATHQYLNERRSKTNAAFEKNLSDREYRFEKNLQERDEAFERSLEKRNRIPGPR
jgi:hypothetical protein